MIFKIRIAHWRFTWTFAPVTDVTGVNSNLPEGDHIYMWDFDDIPLEEIISNLHYVKSIFQMPNIYILNTGKPNHFIAYCFKAMPWRESVIVVATTRCVDPNFFKYGVYREHWTLRVTPKEGRKPHLVKILWSSIEEDCSIDELNSWVQDTQEVHYYPFETARHFSSYMEIPNTCPPKIRNARRRYTNEEVGAKCHP